MSSAAPLQQATANSHSEARNTPRQLRQNSARSASEKQNSFADSRPQTAIQRRLRETAADSPQTTQLLALQRMAAASEHANQLKAMKATASAAALQRVEDEEPLQAKFSAIQRVEEEEPLQGKFSTAQRVEEDEPLQNKLMTAQRTEDEELLQGKFAPVQRVEEDELLQGKFDTVQRQEQVAARPNNTGLPNQLKSGIESLSGMSMDHVKVHYNSSQPAQLNALAYAQGSDIHVAPGQEQHLPHEAWHVVQQAQGRVKPTMQMKGGVPVNDDVGLETEADVMGAKALSIQKKSEDGSTHGASEKTLHLDNEAQSFGFNVKELIDIKRKIDGIDGGGAVQRHKTDVVQQKSTCAGLAYVNYANLNSDGKAAYNLLDNKRANFANIDKTDGGVNAITDSQSRVISAERTISSTAAPRSSIQTTIGWLGRLEEGKTTGYDGGHLIASSLGGPGTWGNMVPQDYIENRWGDWRKYEREVKAVIAKTGSPPILKVQLGYSGDSVLPSTWDSWLDDKHGVNLNWYSMF
ncbi:DNA/RNA non-specific endonuclease [Undibacterium aquatile]|uniref:DNA/RNA non-specific endonuclease n=1 Tax=Undibacterium aquatile TaxID=1537398 RepID=A0ABR6XH05_9BURK|nr:DNA/RNA non-specific endonuclease [Undibacterium aquatile]MBC3812164.1 DNA/RNA non-specific endonuclease [Undibacterium aquatile]